MKPDLSILEIGGGGELIRSIAENLQLKNSSQKIGQQSLTTSLHYIGQPLHLIDWLEHAQELGDWIFLAAHGDETGIHFGEDFADFIDTSMLKEGYFPYALFFKLGKFEGKTLFNSACASATKEVNAQFIAQKNFAYVGYDGYPDGDADILIYHKLFYELCHGAPLDEAIRRTHTICPDAQFLRLFE